MMQLPPAEILDRFNPKDFSLDGYSNSPIGCFLQFDLDYLDKLHDFGYYYLLGAKKGNDRRNFVRILTANHRRS